jgi:hypothetical protein
MKAEEMRKITEQAELKCANEFWEEFKDKLFKGLKRQAESRSFSITIGYMDELAKTREGADWISYKPLRDKVKQELESLGYKFSYDNDRNGNSVNISWQ